MTEDDKKRADILVELYQQAYQNFERRRTYEWKLSLAIWTALAVFIGLALRGETSGFNYSLFIIVALLAIFLHGFFIYRVKLAHDVDKRKAELYEQKLNELVGVSFGLKCDLDDPKEPYDYSTEATKAIELVTSKKGLGRYVGRGNWGVFVQVGFTILLMFAGLLVVLASRANRTAPGSRHLESKVIGVGSTSIDLDSR